MQTNLFKIFLITAAFSTMQSASVETAEGQVAQSEFNITHTNKNINVIHVKEAHVDEADVERPI
ncbi:hypothetical protein NW762_013383 [Fusarium torreyae]|uniref:Uncharacterized protein n=1 Tax=Fusarium torreyae TaxID=1237075 RepID=A0A9W8RPC2_9HYPO|nr:hypothetical protein NW762_013383 [Fusarium torreyae]